MTQPLTDAINALTTYANETTGQSDTTLSDAVRTLCDGYGGGGDSGMDDWNDFSGGNIQAIIGTGEQYILTDFLIDRIGMFALKFKDTNTTAYEGYWSTAYNSQTLGVQRANAGSSVFLNMGQGTQYTLGAQSTMVNGGVIMLTNIGMGFANQIENKPLVIFANYYRGEIESPKGAFTFYGFNVLDEHGKYKLRFVPWLDNGEACVKELITGNIYRNAGTGTFGYIDANGTPIE